MSSYSCSCVAGFTGIHCETGINSVLFTLTRVILLILYLSVRKTNVHVHASYFFGQHGYCIKKGRLEDMNE